MKERLQDLFRQLAMGRAGAAEELAEVIAPALEKRAKADTLALPVVDAVQTAAATTTTKPSGKTATKKAK